MKLFYILYFIALPAFPNATDHPYWHRPSWDQGHIVTEARENIYQLENDEKIIFENKGKIHTLIYPVTTTELLIPFEPLKRFLESDNENPLRQYFYRIARRVSPFKSLDHLYQWLGMTSYPLQNSSNIPFPDGTRPNMRMGASLMNRNDTQGLTFSCAVCHSSEIFGKQVLGLTNRFPRENEIFVMAKNYLPHIPLSLFSIATQANDHEKKMFAHTQEILKWVGVKKPQVLGLDTSLAQVALSLSLREQDPYATKTQKSAKYPRPSKLGHFVADSKPAVWWNLKYKNRWLSDGSIVSGNPIFTNFLWNEIGRGADLKKLEEWMWANQKTVIELTQAVFANQAPQYTDFFPAASINLERAKRGEAHFNQLCSGCHGVYHKAWGEPDANQLSYLEKLKTIKVDYHQQTPVIDVGTDPNRYLGMKEFADSLNKLQISKRMKTVVQPQKGYVPPPLVGIWSRWPYFHNNSIPNLCVLLTKTQLRPKKFYMGAPINPLTDFDSNCNGYPLGNKTPESWKKDNEYLYNTDLDGLSNKGHDEGIFLDNGVELLSSLDKKDLIEFLKTL